MEADVTELEMETDELKVWMGCTVQKECLIPHLVDEIALEGLDGITLQALQVRLKQRRGLPMEMTNKSMNRIWDVLRRMKGIDIYELPVPRDDLVLYNRSEFVDERGNIYEPLSAPEDIYLYNPIEDKAKGNIRGSCPHYYTRKRIPGIRNKPLEFVQQIFGNKLVLVASQKLREQAMLGSESEGTDHLTLIQYCMLERIARARYEGELTRGNVSLSIMKIDPKSLFYQRKYLIRKKMIKKQVFSMKFGKNRSTSLISVLHIPRFFTPVVPLAVANARRMIAYLMKKPKMREESVEIKKKFGKTTYRNLLTKDFEKIFKEVDVSLAELNPEQFLSEKKEVKRESLLKRTQKCFLFLNPPGDIESYLPNVKEPDSRGGEPKSDINMFLKGIVYRPQATLFDTPLHQSQEFIIGSGPEGVALSQISSQIHMHTLAARASGRYATRLKYVKTNLVERKKTKVNKYIFTGQFPVPISLSRSYDYTTKEQPKLVSNKNSEAQKSKSQSQITPINALSNNHKKFAAVQAPDQLSSQNQFIEPVQDSEATVRPNFLNKPVVTIPIPTPDEFSLTALELDESSDSPSSSSTSFSSNSRKRKRSETRLEDVRFVGDGNTAADQAQPREKFARLLLGKPSGKVRREREIKPKGSTLKKTTIGSIESSYYDDRDLEALAKKNKQRVAWSVEEDQIILLLFISSVVFIRRYNLKKMFIFNAAQIRDMLHIKNESSRNKTSIAIRRRLHFLMRNPTFKSKYTFYLHDAVRDDYIQNTFVADCIKEVGDDNKIFYDIPTDAILQVYDYFLRKHGNEFAQMRKDPSVLPSALKNHVLQNMETSIVPSTSFLSREMNQSEMELGDESNVSGTGSYFRGSNDDTTSLSASVGVDVAMEVQTKNNEEQSPDRITIEEIEYWAYDTIKEVMVDATKDPITLEELETWIARTVVFSLMFSGDCLDDVQTFLERIGDSNLDFISTNCRRLNICSVSRRSHKFGLSLNMRRRLANHLQPTAYRLTEQFLQEIKKGLHPTHPAVTNNCASLFLLIEFLMDSKVQFDIFVSRDCTKEPVGDKEKSAAPFASQPAKKKKSKVLGEEDVSSVNLPTIKTQLCERVDELVYSGKKKPNLAENFKYLKGLLFREVPNEYADDYLAKITEKDTLAIKYASLYQLIEKCEVVGISMRLLLTKFTRPSLKNGLLFLLENKYIYTVGVTQRKFVSAKHVIPWSMLVPTTKQGRTSDMCRVLIHPWISSAGLINWELIDRMFAAAIGILCRHPGIQVRQLIKFLSPVISGVELILLLEALHHFGFIIFYKFTQSHPVDLFSKSCTYSQDNDGDFFLDLEDLCIELKPFVTTKYASLREMFSLDTSKSDDIGDPSEIETAPNDNNLHRSVASVFSDVPISVSEQPVAPQTTLEPNVPVEADERNNEEVLPSIAPEKKEDSLSTSRRSKPQAPASPDNPKQLTRARAAVTKVVSSTSGVKSISSTRRSVRR